MTAERQPNMFIVLAKGMMVVGKSDFVKDHNKNDHSECVFMDFDKAKEVALAFRKENNIPCEICMLSSLTGDITPESLDSPMFDYVPQNIEDIRNAIPNAEENRDKHHGLEEAGKIMELLKQLGTLIDKAKSEN